MMTLITITIAIAKELGFAIPVKSSRTRTKRINKEKRVRWYDVIMSVLKQLKKQLVDYWLQCLIGIILYKILIVFNEPM